MTETVKIKVSTLSGTALNWAVAYCLEPDNTKSQIINNPCLVSHNKYNEDWELSGPIIEREGISIIRAASKTEHPGYFINYWVADIGRQVRDESVAPYGRYWGAEFSISNNYYVGSTPLVAAMRCYVASKLGGEVEIPSELI